MLFIIHHYIMFATSDCPCNNMCLNHSALLAQSNLKANAKVSIYQLNACVISLAAIRNIQASGRPIKVQEIFNAQLRWVLMRSWLF